MTSPTTSYTVEYASSSGIPAVLVFRTLAQARGKARLLRRIGRDPVIHRRDANGATLVPFHSSENAHD